MFKKMDIFDFQLNLQIQVGDIYFICRATDKNFHTIGCVYRNVYTQKIVQCTQCTQQCTLCVHTCQMFTTSGRVQLYTVRQYRMSVRCMAASDIRISTSSREFSIWIFLPTQICRILENFFDFSKVPDRFSTSWNCELHSINRRQPYTIMAM